MAFSHNSISPTPTTSSSDEADSRSDFHNETKGIFSKNFKIFRDFLRPGPLHHGSRCSELLQKRVHRLYAFWARLVVAHAYKISVVCLVISAVCAVKLFKTK